MQIKTTLRFHLTPIRWKFHKETFIKLIYNNFKEVTEVIIIAHTHEHKKLFEGRNQCN
jgi:hypothetical protein